MLYPKEKLILKFIARGWSHSKICDSFHMNASCMHTHCFNIRKKTGIKDTKSSQECNDYLYGHGKTKIVGDLKIKDKNSPTQAQLRVMHLFSQGLSHQQIAAELAISIQTARNHLADGCGRVRLDPVYSRPEALKKYFNSLRRPMDDPMF